MDFWICTGKLRKFCLQTSILAKGQYRVPGELRNGPVCFLEVKRHSGPARRSLAKGGHAGSRCGSLRSVCRTISIRGRGGRDSLCGIEKWTMRLWITIYRLMQGTPSLSPRCRWNGRLNRFLLAYIRNLNAESAGSGGGRLFAWFDLCWSNTRFVSGFYRGLFVLEARSKIPYYPDRYNYLISKVGWVQSRDIMTNYFRKYNRGTSWPTISGK